MCKSLLDLTHIQTTYYIDVGNIKSNYNKFVYIIQLSKISRISKLINKLLIFHISNPRKTYRNPIQCGNLSSNLQALSISLYD